MSLVAEPPAPDPQVVAFEAIDRLRSIDVRGILRPRDLAEAWTELHRCDRMVLVTLEPRMVEHYQAVVDTRRPRLRPSRWSRRTPIHGEVACLRVARHRRLMVLQRIANDAVVPGR